jgi:hypothetical protein
MDKLLDTFSLGFLLRSGFSGAFFVLAVNVASADGNAIANFEPIASLSVVLVVAIVAGVSLYTIHRSLLFPLIEWGMNSHVALQLRSRMPLISAETKLLLFTNWTRRAGAVDKSSSDLARHLSAWGDYAHFQYTSALCIAVGAIIGAHMAHGDVRVHGLMLTAALVMLFAAVVSDWRWHAFVDFVKSKESDSAT